MSELYGESANDTKIEEHLEESSISQDDCKKLKQENENYRQELYVLRLKLETSEALIKDLQHSGEILEMNFKERVRVALASSSEKEEKYKAQQREYENHIADLETDQVKSELEINELQKELKKYKDLVNKRPCHLVEMEDTLMPYKEQLVELSTLLENEKRMLLEKEKNEKELMDKLANMEAQYEELQHNLNKTKKQLAEKNKELDNAQESIRELATNLMELESSNITPASDTCKGNSLFAEVEDRRQMLLDKMKVLLNKYNETKQALNMKITEVKLLRAEKVTMARKWETDAIDTLQENTDLLNKYKSRIFDLENKLKAEMKKKDQLEEIQSTDNDSFNYAQSLLFAKGKELKELNEKFEKQAMQMLVQDEINHNISRQLRYWQPKAMFLEAQITTIKDQLKLQETSDSKILLESIENCTFPENVNSKNIFGDSFTSHEFTKAIPKCEFADQENSTKVSKKPAMDSANKQKESRRFVDFASDTKDFESKSLKKSLKKQAKQHDYPVVVYKDDDALHSVPHSDLI